MSVSRVLATADLHGNLPAIPDCDVLLVAGDICPDFLNGWDKGRDRQKQWLDFSFRPWLEELRDRGIEVVGIAGNHDWVFERGWLWRQLELPWTYLLDNMTTLHGLRIYGTPWVPNLPGWAFYGSPAMLEARAWSIPSDIDILLSHGPPHGAVDRVCGGYHVGDRHLSEALPTLSPKALVCGHIHEAFGYADVEGISVYNVSHVDENYNVAHVPVEIVL